MNILQLEKQIFEGITHVEDLKIDQFISALRNFENFEISEKVDGSNLQYGIDEKGFYTTREDMGPSGQRMYNVEQYPVNYATTFQRSAHMALEKKLPEMVKHGLSRGDRVEVEVLFGKLPNAVPYSSDKNQIILLRVVEGDVDLDSLRKSLDGDTVVVELPAPYTLDGKTIRVANEKHQWTFAKTPTMSGNDLIDDNTKARLNKDLDELEAFLKRPSGIWEFSNAEILSIPLNKRPEGVEPAQWKDLKVQVKQARTEVQKQIYADEGGQRTGFKSKIKDTLLNSMVRQIQSAFGPEIKDGGWIEGVVFRDPSSGEMFKVVDKDMFSSVKNFLWQVRSDLSDKPRNVDKVESFMGKVLQGLASSLGHPELGTHQAKRHLRKQGDSKQEILSNMASDINFEQVREYWISFLNQQEKKLSNELEKYRGEAGDKKFKTNFNGQEREFSYDEEVDKRTLQVFSQMYQQLENFKKGAKDAKSAEDLIMLLSGRQLSSL